MKVKEFLELIEKCHPDAVICFEVEALKSNEKLNDIGEPLWEDHIVVKTYMEEPVYIQRLV